MASAAKKWLTGCLVVLLLFVLALAAGWWFVLRPMWNAGVAGATDWVSALDLGDDIADTTPFTPPADGRLTPAQVERLVQVQAVVVQDMGADLGRLSQRLQEADALRRGDAAPSLDQLGAAYTELRDLLGRARAAQARGVNAASFSRDEYAWVRRQAMAALPRLADVSTLPGVPTLPTGLAPADDDAAAYNAALLRPHLPLLRQGLGVLPDDAGG